MNDAIVEKIKKLLALSGSNNENEAASALRKAHQLLLDYDLSMDQVEKSENNIHSLELLKFAREQAWKTVLVNAVADYNFCKVLNRKSYIQVSRNKAKPSYCYEIYGSEVDIHVCREMFEYLTRSILIMTRNSSKDRKDRPYKESYKLGMAYKISERLIKFSDEEKVVSHQNALVLSYQKTRNSEIDNHWEKLGFNIQNKKSRSRRVYSDAFDAGYEKADSINLAKQVGLKS